ncbi:hypothetical protein EYC80_004978 [Monilinia laxa]|uniref:DUF676 domain-containing protein n=1 Tax=Monilinia laxa TaxID=61186 RepID=A0A5N6KIR4_MONLA|nr:hypothetical protein EYC80_004978 [Monilinia laxa]
METSMEPNMESGLPRSSEISLIELKSVKSSPTMRDSFADNQAHSRKSSAEASRNGPVGVDDKPKLEVDDLAFKLNPRIDTKPKSTKVDRIGVPAIGGHPEMIWIPEAKFVAQDDVSSPRESKLKSAFINVAFMSPAYPQPPSKQSMMHSVNRMEPAWITGGLRGRKDLHMARVLFTGGLVAKIALNEAQRSKDPILDDCYGVKFFATPHRGSSYLSQPGFSTSIREIISRQPFHAPITSIKSAILNLCNETVYPLVSTYTKCAAFSFKNRHTKESYLQALVDSVKKACELSQVSHCELNLEERIKVEINGFYEGINMTPKNELPIRVWYTNRSMREFMKYGPTKLLEERREEASFAPVSRQHLRHDTRARSLLQEKTNHVDNHKHNSLNPKSTFKMNPFKRGASPPQLSQKVLKDENRTKPLAEKTGENIVNPLPSTLIMTTDADDAINRPVLLAADVGVHVEMSGSLSVKQSTFRKPDFSNAPPRASSDQCSNGYTFLSIILLGPVEKRPDIHSRMLDVEHWHSKHGNTGFHEDGGEEDYDEVDENSEDYETQSDTGIASEDDVLDGNVLMVDQLCLWIIDSVSAVTFFPRRAGLKTDGRLYQQADLRNSIFNEVNADLTSRCENSYGLAALIAHHAVTILFERTSHPDSKIFRTFEEAISILTEKMTSFKNFRARGFRDKVEDIDDLRTSSIRAKHQREGQTAEKQNRDNTSALLELRDIEDELNTLKILFTSKMSEIKDMLDMYEQRKLTTNGLVFLRSAADYLEEYTQHVEMMASLRYTHHSPS